MTIERSSYLKYVSRKKEKESQKYWHELFENENENPCTNVAEIKEVRSLLDHLHQEHYRGAIVQARADKFLLGARFAPNK